MASRHGSWPLTSGKNTASWTVGVVMPGEYQGLRITPNVYYHAGRNRHLFRCDGKHHQERQAGLKQSFARVCDPAVMADSLEVTPAEARRHMQAADGAALIDVREPEEFAIAHVESSELIPMNTIPAQLQQLEALADDKPLLLLCHHGARSLQVAAWLRNQGIENCFSVAGGIDRWSLEVDGAIPRY